MSVLVIAGASQFTALQLLGEHAPLVIVIVTSLAVNLRFAMYSASLAPHIGAAPAWLRALAAYFAGGPDLRRGDRPLRPAPPMRLPSGSGISSARDRHLPLVFRGLVRDPRGDHDPGRARARFRGSGHLLALSGPAVRSLPHLVAALSRSSLSLGLAPSRTTSG